MGATQPTVTLADPFATRDAARRARYREYLDFYQGRQWLGRPLPTERRLTANYARALVRKCISYLFPEPPVFSVVPDRESAAGQRRASVAEVALGEVYAANDLAMVDPDAAIDAAVLGDGAFKVTWDAARRLPVVTSVDVQSISAWWLPDDPRAVTRVAQRYAMAAGEAAERFKLVLPLAPDSQVAVVEDWRADRYTVSVGSQVAVDAANPFGWVPYVLFPNERESHEFWGKSDLADLIEPARELNRRMSIVGKVLELSGSPIAVLENVEHAEGIRVGPGALWELPEGAKAYLLDLLKDGGMKLHLDYIELLYRTLHDLSETPRTAFGDSGRALSGTALEVEIQPLVQKVKRKRRIWDAVYQRRNAMCLDLLARFGSLPIGNLRRTKTLWGSILPSDRSAIVRQEVSLVGAGLTSRRASIARLGAEDPERELQQMAAESRAVEQQQQ